MPLFPYSPGRLCNSRRHCPCCVPCARPFSHGPPAFRTRRRPCRLHRRITRGQPRRARRTHHLSNGLPECVILVVVIPPTEQSRRVIDEARPAKGIHLAIAAEMPNDHRLHVRASNKGGERVVERVERLPEWPERPASRHVQNFKAHEVYQKKGQKTTDSRQRRFPFVLCLLSSNSRLSIVRCPLSFSLPSPSLPPKTPRAGACAPALVRWPFGRVNRVAYSATSTF